MPCSFQSGRLLFLPQGPFHLGPVRLPQAGHLLGEGQRQPGVGRPPVVFPIHALADGQGLAPPCQRPAPVTPKLVQLGQPGQRLGDFGRRLRTSPALQLQDALGDGYRLIELPGLAKLLDLLRQLVPLLDLLLRLPCLSCPWGLSAPAHG